jgi:hypothetical protein
MPKYTAKITETIYRVAYITVEAEDEGDAWDRAESEMYSVPDDRFLTLDGNLEVSDLELDEKTDGPCPLAAWYDTSAELE